jgi:Tfp pilus assembly protein PilF
MLRVHRLGILLFAVWAAILSAIAIPSLRSRAGGAPQKPQGAPKSETKGNEAEAFRNNTLGVAYMNQQKFAGAQKNFEKSLAADPNFAIARLNLGIALLSQQ